MTFKTRRRIRIIRNYAISWALSFVFLVIVRGIGTVEEGMIDFDTWTALMIAVPLGLFFGCISGFIQILYEERSRKKISLEKMMLFRSLYMLLFLSGLILGAYAIVWIFLDVRAPLLEFAFDTGSIPVYLYIIFFEGLITFVSQIKLLLGETHFNQLRRARFFSPREEQRIFMFLDLQSSTEIAEELGHIRYSQFIQDCFEDVSIVIEFEAMIYQYVGDEVVLTWDMQKGLKDNNCIQAFFSFLEQIDKRKEYYLNEYGRVPVFKAGVHGGQITIAEVGVYKRDIAYHGDTINTSARIQSMCNALNAELLTSEYLKEHLNTLDFSFEEKGSIELRGKKQRVVLYSVTR